MNRIPNLWVLPAIAALVFFLITCSNENPIDNNGKIDSSSSISDGTSSSLLGGIFPGSSSSEQESEPSSPSTEPESSDSGQEASSSSDEGSSSADTQNDSSSSVVSSSVSGTSSSSRSGSSSSRSTASSSSVKSSSSTGSQINPVPSGKADYTETVGSASFDMIYIPGGKFTLGCETNCQPGAVKPVDAEVSSYFIMKAEATSTLWRAVMGESHAGGTWYEAIEFACELSKKTNKNYRMMTEAEFEYAAKNYKSKLSNIGGNGMTGEEWAYNSWDADKHMGGKDPVGPTSGAHTQKTRRDADANGADRVTSRLIRSIDGIGPATRLVVSAEMAYPPGYVPSCDIHAPKLEGGEPTNSYRDPRWITGDGYKWGKGSIAIGSIDLQVWEDGTAKLGNTAGQWFTSNNIAFVFVPNSGSVTKYAYIFLDANQGSVISEKDFTAGGYVGRFEKTAASGSKPTVSDLKTGEALARAQPGFDSLYKMVDMEALPKTAGAITASYKQDSRLLDGGDTKGWFQDNTSMQGAHHYRKDVDSDEFRFTVNQNNQRAAVLAVGKWFTINNTFLRVIHKNGYIADYLYTVTSGSSPTFYHNSFMGYERADFRMFKKETNGSSWPRTTCGDICSKEIPKGLDPAAMYVNDKEKGQSTFTPAKCPSGGCR
ncbi:MAG: formylglycine-generating enzyme family protein [Fibromonadaceae bacterium]|jgi:hypothetical protein|nr:formylglycine-generating enzyme family protein [Fibromonadaceae bacterium]